MDEIHAEWHDSHIWNAGQPDLKTLTPPSLAAHYSCSMTPHAPVGICCEHAGVMQRADDQGHHHAAHSDPCWFPAACRVPKLTGVLPACFQVNQVKKPFYGMISYESRNADFDSDGDFNCFMRHASKAGFSTIQIKTGVHRAEYSALCGRHRFSAFNRFAISC